MKPSSFYLWGWQFDILILNKYKPSCAIFFQGFYFTLFFPLSEITRWCVFHNVSSWLGAVFSMRLLAVSSLTVAKKKKKSHLSCFCERSLGRQATHWVAGAFTVLDNFVWLYDVFMHLLWKWWGWQIPFRDKQRNQTEPLSPVHKHKYTCTHTGTWTQTGKID